MQEIRACLDKMAKKESGARMGNRDRLVSLVRTASMDSAGPRETVDSPGRQVETETWAA